MFAALLCAGLSAFHGSPTLPLALRPRLPLLPSRGATLPLLPLRADASFSAPEERQPSGLAECLGGLSPARVTVLSAGTNVMLSLFKVTVGTVAGSASLVADGAHSCSDLLSDAMCWVVVKTGRFELVCTLAIAGMLLGTGLTMVTASAQTLVTSVARNRGCLGCSTRAAMDYAALGVAMLSVAVKELLFRVTRNVGTRVSCKSLIANAYHHRSDALSSLVAIVGIGGVLAGFGWADAAAATAVGALIACMGVDVARESIVEAWQARHAAGAADGEPPRPGPARSPTPRMAFHLPARALTAAAGGTAAGALHAVSGPDHLSCLLPLCVGRRWWLSIYSGVYWGLGHGIGAAIVGAVAYTVRGALNLDAFSKYMEAVVGLSIVVIGATGVQEARQCWRVSVPEAGVDPNSPPSPGPHPIALAGTSSVAALALDDPSTGGDRGAICSVAASPSVLSTLGTGVLNGVTGSGHILGVMPAMAMPNWLCAAAYLTSFGLGTLVAMAGFTAVIGEFSSQMSAQVDDPLTPARLAMASSLVALSVGLAWTIKALVALGMPQQVARLFPQLL